MPGGIIQTNGQLSFSGAWLWAIWRFPPSLINEPWPPARGSRWNDSAVIGGLAAVGTERVTAGRDFRAVEERNGFGEIHSVEAGARAVHFE